MPLAYGEIPISGGDGGDGIVMATIDNNIIELADVKNITANISFNLKEFHPLGEQAVQYKPAGGLGTAQQHTTTYAEPDTAILKSRYKVYSGTCGAISDIVRIRSAELKTLFTMRKEIAVLIAHLYFQKKEFFTISIPKNHKTKEAAVYLGISRDSLEELVRKGQIVRFKLGGLWYYCETDLDEYYRHQRQNGIAIAVRLRNGVVKRPKLKPHERKTITMEEALECWR